MSHNPFVPSISPFANLLLPKKEENKEPTVTVATESKVEIPEGELEYQKILREHGYLESNIPINSSYWNLRP